MKKIISKLCFFVSLPSNSWQYLKQLMTKISNVQKEKLAQINRNLGKKKKVASFSLWFYALTD